MIIKDMPLFWRLLPKYTAHPPAGIPQYADLEVVTDPFGLVERRLGVGDTEVLRNIYCQPRSLLDTRASIADNERYYFGFYQFLRVAWGKNNPPPRWAYEYGAGDGFLTMWLGQWARAASGEEMGPEPDVTFSAWISYNGRQQFWRGREQPDLIVHHHTLEHVPDPVIWLADQAALLHPEGRIMFAVPDCTASIAAGDISMFLHQHLSYWDVDRLRFALMTARLMVDHWTRSAGSIYISARKLPDGFPRPTAVASHALPQRFEDLAAANIERFANAYAGAAPGELGVYCPLRAIPYLAAIQCLQKPRLFDDGMVGKFIDGMTQPIEGLQDLLADPPAAVLVMSYTNGDAIADRLDTALEAHSRRTIEVTTLADIIPEPEADAVKAHS